MSGLETSKYSASHPAMAPFRTVPWPTGRLFLMQLLVLAPLLGPMAAAIPLLSLSPSFQHGWPGLVVVAGAFGVSLALTIPSVRFLGRAEMVRQRRQDEAKLAPIRADERYVGVSYSSGIATKEPDTSWDRGWLRWDGVVLRFRGYGPALELPADRIRAVFVAAGKSWISGVRWRTMVRWVHPEGTDEWAVPRNSGCLRRPNARRMRRVAPVDRSWSSWRWVPLS